MATGVNACSFQDDEVDVHSEKNYCREDGCYITAAKKVHEKTFIPTNFAHRHRSSAELDSWTDPQRADALNWPMEHPLSVNRNEARAMIGTSVDCGPYVQTAFKTVWPLPHDGIDGMLKVCRNIVSKSYVQGESGLEDFTKAVSLEIEKECDEDIKQEKQHPLLRQFVSSVATDPSGDAVWKLKELISKCAHMHSTRFKTFLYLLLQLHNGLQGEEHRHRCCDQVERMHKAG